MFSAHELPFLEPSPLPFGFPDLAAIRAEHLVPAAEAGMAQQRAQVEAIVANPEPPTFENTLVALECSGEILRRVTPVLATFVGALSSPEISEIDAELAPRLAAHADAITLDAGLCERIETLHQTRHDLGLDPESLRLLEHRRRDAVRAGALLDPAQQQRLRAINVELSELTTAFGTRLLADTGDSAVVVTDSARLDGLPPDAIAAAARAATARGIDGHLLTLVLPTEQPVLAALTDRSLREQVHRASTGRGARGGPHDTRDLVLAISELRAERAGLLGHPNHASWVSEVGAAGTVDAVDTLLARLVPAAVTAARAEAAQLEAAAGHGIEAWDRAFHAERLRHGVDLRPYLELERVLRHGVFAAAERLYGLAFTQRYDLPVHHPDIRVFTVHDADGSELGLFVADLFARPSKRGGAWMHSFVTQSRLLGTRPVVLNTLNITPAADGEPVLLRPDEVRTLFHEFGHALHGLLSDVQYPTFSGTAVPRDVVEFPSQVNEMWLAHPEILDGYARHHRTGEPLPPELAGLLTQRAAQGHAMTEYLAAALLDLAWHRLDPGERVEDVAAFEAAALARAGVAVPASPPRYRSTYFNHVFAGAYSAGYYSYVWSEVLDADAVAWFVENGGPTRANGDALRSTVLSRGGAVDPMSAYREFRGRDPEIAPLLERRFAAAGYDT